MKRRDFLLLTGGAAGAIVLGRFAGTALSVGDRYSSVADSLPEVMPRVESFTSTTCLMCPGGCGLKIRRVDEVPVGITGNPNHPLNSGGVCTEGTAALQLLYHPDRLLQPMRRRGGQRSNSFEPVSWEEGLGEIVRAMKGLHDKKTPQRLAFVMGRSGGSMEELLKHFMSIWGSPNLLVDQPQDGYARVFEAMHGLPSRPAFDFDNARLILSFGADLLHAWETPVRFQRSYASLRESSRTPQGSLIVADTRLSRTAARAQEWVGVRPGSYGALALGIAYVMLREELYDAQFVEEHLYGFEDSQGVAGNFRRGFRNLVLHDYSPEVVSHLTGVPVERILSLGKSFGQSSSALAVFDENVTAQPGGIYAAMAIHCLNLLKGNLNKPGGIYLQPEVPLKPLSGANSQRRGSPETLLVEDLAALTSTKDSPDIVFLYYSNPVYSSPLRRQLEEALAKVPLVVSFSPFLDETSRFVNLMLPDSLFLERWEDRFFPPSFPASGWGIVQPCIPAAGNTRHTGDVILQIARQFGSPLSEALPWEGFQQLLKHRARGLYETHAGTLCIDPFQQGLVSEMERRGWWISNNQSFDEFWKRLLETGAWTDPNYQVRTLRDYSGRPDGRIDLRSRTLERRLSRAASQLLDTDCLPHQVNLEEHPADSDYPLTLNPFRLAKYGGGTSAALPWILQGAGLLQNTAWNSWAEIHPADARQHEIKNRDWIWVESAAGKVKVRAVVYPGVGRGVVNIPYGLGHTEMGRWAQGRGVNPMDLLTGNRDPLSGLPQRFGTRVKIHKA